MSQYNSRYNLTPDQQEYLGNWGQNPQPEPSPQSGISNILSSPGVQSALISGAGGALGQAIGGPLGGAIGAGVGPVAENLLTSGEDTPRELLIESALAALGGGGGGSLFGPLGAGTGGAAGAYLGERFTQ